MAVVNLLPNADVDTSSSPAWTIGTGSDVYAVLDDDDAGHVTSDSSDIEATTAGKICEVEFQNHSLDAGTTINSIQPIVKHNNRGRGTNYGIGVETNHSGGTYYSEVIFGNGAASWVTASLGVRLTSDGIGGTAWTLDDINGLQMNLELLTISGGTVGITYAYFRVLYTVAVTDNATFFGANF